MNFHPSSRTRSWTKQKVAVVVCILRVSCTYTYVCLSWSVGSKSNNNLHWKPCDRPCQARHTRFDTMSNVGQENTSHRVFHPIFTPNSKYNRSQALITLSLAARVSWTDLFRRIGSRLVVVGWVEEQLMLIRRRVIAYSILSFGYYLWPLLLPPIEDCTTRSMMLLFCTRRNCCPPPSPPPIMDIFVLVNSRRK